MNGGRKNKGKKKKGRTRRYLMPVYGVSWFLKTFAIDYDHRRVKPHCLFNGLLAY
jgi:hypothetical protein